MTNFSFNRQIIISHVGKEYFHRGLLYYTQGRVKGVQLAGEGAIKGIVLGSNPRPYRARIFFDGGGIDFSECSCPIGERCKHIAALGLAALDKAMSLSQESEAEVPAQSAVKLLPAPYGARQRREEKRIKPSGWQAVLERSLEKRQKEQSNILHEAQLVFRLSDVPVNSWNTGGKTRRVLQVRPRFLNPQTNKISMTLLQWKDFRQYQSYRLSQTPISSRAQRFLRLFIEELDAEQEQSSRYFARNKLVYYAAHQAWMNISGNRAELLWTLMQRHEEYDVTLWFGENSSSPLVIGKEHLTLAALIEDDKDGIRISKKAFLGSTSESEYDTIVLYGDKPIFAFVAGQESHSAEGGSPFFTFAPVVSKYHANIFANLEKPLLVPGKELDEFTQMFLPGLMRSVDVKNFSSRVILPEIMPPKLCVDVTRSGPLGIMVAIAWQYGARLIDEKGNARREERSGILRDQDAEKRVYKKFVAVAAGQRWFQTRQHMEIPYRLTLEKLPAAEFVNGFLPHAESMPDVVVKKASDLPAFTFLKDDPQAELHLETGESEDWFDLRVKITIAGQEITLAQILPALEAGENVLFTQEGNAVDLTGPFFLKLKVLMRQAARLPESQTGAMSVSRFQAGWWEELKQLGVVGRQAQAWQETVGRLLDSTHIAQPLTPPPGLKTELRPYQKEGLAWLLFLRKNHLGGVLADDMGLGKTVQSIALLCHAKDEEMSDHQRKQSTMPRERKSTRRPFLIIAPTSVVENWDAEFKRFAPSLNVIALRRGTRSGLHQQMATADAVLVSYALLWRDESHFQKIAWDTVILDEAQFVKNHQSKAYALIRQLTAACRIALTGTPLENNIMELWSLFSIVAPGLFPPPERFKEVFQHPIEKGADKEALEQLRRRVKPFMLRRKKELVEKDLPPKTEAVILLDMEEKQRKIYDLFLHKQRQKVLGLLAQGGLKAHRFEILTALTRMRQMCLHPVLADAKYQNYPSAKLEALMEYLANLIAEDHKVLVYSQFTSFLALARKKFDDAKIVYSYLDGATKNRKVQVENFQNNPRVKAFLISLKAGGTGLNLTAAEYCIILDPWWNPAVESQAIARAHRIGQTKSVTAYKFIMKDSIEEKVLKLQEKKKRLFENVIEEGDAFGSLITETDIRALFST